MEAAKARVQSLNPLVVVETHTDHSLLVGERLASLVESVDLVCVTDWDRDGLVSDLPSQPSLDILMIRYIRLRPVSMTSVDNTKNHSTQAVHMACWATFSVTCYSMITSHRGFDVSQET